MSILSLFSRIVREVLYPEERKPSALSQAMEQTQKTLSLSSLQPLRRLDEVRPAATLDPQREP